jgi:uncharacterized membrane protein
MSTTAWRFSGTEGADAAVLRLKQLDAQSLAKRIKKACIDGALLQAVKDDMQLGTSALIVLSADAALDAVAKAFAGQAMELIRSDLSVQQEDTLRTAFNDQPR